VPAGPVNGLDYRGGHTGPPLRVGADYRGGHTGPPLCVGADPRVGL
jgi:hypothetical protein